MVATDPALHSLVPGGVGGPEELSEGRGTRDLSPVPTPSPCHPVPFSDTSGFQQSQPSLATCTQSGEISPFSGQDCFPLIFLCRTPDVASPLPGQEANGKRPSRGTPHRPKGENLSAPAPPFTRAPAHREAGQGLGVGRQGASWALLSGLQVGEAGQRLHPTGKHMVMKRPPGLCVSSTGDAASLGRACEAGDLVGTSWEQICSRGTFPGAHGLVGLPALTCSQTRG